MTGKPQNYNSSDLLAHHPFVQLVLLNAFKISASIQVKGSVFKVDAKYTRDPTEAEYYYIATGNTLAHFLSTCRQLEHCILYFSSFYSTAKMKRAGVSKHSYLLYCIENYIIRTQSFYDRLLRFIDKLFCLYNPSYLISHELIVSNTHIKHTEVPSSLKTIRKIIKAYYRDRNEIMHERQYLEDDLRRLEAYTILATDGPYKEDENFKLGIKDLVHQIIKGKTREFTKVNKDAFTAIAELFDKLEPLYDEKRNILEAIHGRIEVLIKKE